MNQEAEFDPDTSANHRKTLRTAFDFSLWSERLVRFLEGQPGIGASVVISDMRVPAAGGSSGTLMFTAEFDADGRRKRKELVLRYAVEGGLFHAYNLPGQYAILQGLQGRGVPVPDIAGIDPNGSALGVIGYLMGRVEGEAPPPSYFKVGPVFDATPERRKLMVFGSISAQAKLHALDWKTLGIEFLTTRGNGTTAIERDLDWLWTSLSWGCPTELESLAPIRRWLLDHQPADTGLCLCHGDSMLPNYMFKDGKLTAVLDWELAFLGNPSNDVAYQAFTHSFLGLGAPPLTGCPSIEERRDEYERVSGRRLKHWDYFYTLAAFKVHMSMILVFRDAPPEMEAAKRGALEFTRQSILDGQANGRI